jgi:hypothetical protein
MRLHGFAPGAAGRAGRGIGRPTGRKVFQDAGSGLAEIELGAPSNMQKKDCRVILRDPLTVDLIGPRCFVFNGLRGFLIAEPLIRTARGFDVEDAEKGHRGH